MAKHTSKDQILKDLRTQRQRLERTISALNPEAMLQPGVTGSWSVKAHNHYAWADGLVRKWNKDQYSG